MTPQQAWAHWWARPWTHSPHAWPGLPHTLCRSRHALASRTLGIAPCLPVEPSPVLLQLILASAPQRDLMLMLVDCVFRPTHLSQLDEEQQMWCLRLAKAMPPDPVLTGIDDPLHSLRAWVEPAVWERLRLLFARPRVRALEQHPRFADSHGRLGTLWQAVIWRVSPAPSPRSDCDVMPTHD